MFRSISAAHFFTTEDQNDESEEAAADVGKPRVLQDEVMSFSAQQRQAAERYKHAPKLTASKGYKRPTLKLDGSDDDDDAWAGSKEATCQVWILHVKCFF